MAPHFGTGGVLIVARFVPLDHFAQFETSNLSNLIGEDTCPNAITTNARSFDYRNSTSTSTTLLSSINSVRGFYVAPIPMPRQRREGEQMNKSCLVEAGQEEQGVEDQLPSVQGGVEYHVAQQELPLVHSRRKPVPARLG